MDNGQVIQLMQQLDPDARLLETHISWVILFGDRALKVKKPVRFSFVDFSTREKRRLACWQELELNRRFSPDMYLDVMPIRMAPTGPVLNGHQGRILDHGVLMVRMNPEDQLDLRLRRGEIGPDEIRTLARVLARFHRDAAILPSPPDARQLGQDFADIRQSLPALEACFGPDAARQLETSVPEALRMIQSLEPRLMERAKLGYFRDGHGDLHTRNIFFSDHPVLFDGLEFDARLRHADLLSELAFLGMDLHVLDQGHLWPAFLETYQEILPVLMTREDHLLLNWFLWYRTNIRLKILALARKDRNTDSCSTLQPYWKWYRHFASLCQSVNVKRNTKSG